MKFLILLAFLPVAALAEAPRVLPAGTLPNDQRLQPPKDLNGYFPFTVPTSKDAWEKRAEEVRRQVLIAEGLWPMPTKTPLNAVIHGKIEKPEYSVEKVYFESAPGFFVTGNLYRPAKMPAGGKVPAVMFAHGHWANARLSEETPAKLRQEIATGQERFEEGGRSRFQSMCVQLARMGCIVWQWDMLSDSDSVQFSRNVIHGFAKQRPEMNTTERWGLFSPQAEAHLQSVMGLHTWNSVRSLDFLLSLPEVDPDRIAITGASGGGTQTMLLAAIDPRVKLSFPAVMVSTAMQGGCTCENASLLRVNTGNVEFAATFAPKPQGMTTAADWTKEMSTKGFPELQQLYKLVGAPANVMLQRGEHFPHNYNAVSRSAFFTWLNKHFKLGQEEPVIERDYDVLSREQLSVWNGQHAAPKAEDPEFERNLLKWFTDDATKQLQAAAADPGQLRKVLGGALEVMINRTYAKAGDVAWDLKQKTDRGAYIEMTGLLRNTTYGEELPVAWLYPKQWNGRAVIWLDDEGKAALFDGDGSPQAAVKKLVDAGVLVLGADLLFQGEFTADGQPVKQIRVVANPREFAGYTFGYNQSLFAQRTSDVLTLVTFLHKSKVGTHQNPTSVSLAGFGGTGPIVAAARALAGEAVARAALDTGRFRFAKLLDYRDPQFLPGAAKYLDLPGLLALNAPYPLWVAGELGNAVVDNAYRATDAKVTYHGPSARVITTTAAEWLLK
jgi:dienelactone hydrolase